MLIQLLALYLVSVLGLVWVGFNDKPYDWNERFRMIGSAIAWPVFHLPWAEWHRPGRHRSARHETIGHGWVGWQAVGNA